MATQTKLESFFDAAYSQFCRHSSFFLSVANQNVEIQFGSAFLRDQLTAALAHLAIPPQPCEIKICAWDGGEMPAPPWEEEAYGKKGVVQGWNDERFSFSYHPGSSVFNGLNRDLGISLFWTPSAEALPYWERGAPFLHLMQWNLKSSIVHSAAVGTQAGGVLLAGKGGSGKSTTALSCLDAGLLYLADDYCILGEEAIAYSLYNSAKTVIAGSEEKDLFFHYPKRKAQLVRSLPLRAVLVPRIGKKTRLERCTQAEALLALAPSSLFQLSGNEKHGLAKMSHLVQSLPCYKLHLGPKREEAPIWIERLIEEGKWT